MSDGPAPIAWTPPPPRGGPAGAWDRFIGPGATPAEQWIQVAGAAGLTVALAIWWRSLSVDWSPLQFAVAGVLAFDTSGATFVIVASGFLVAASALLMVTPLYLRRPAGFGLYAASVLLSLYAFVHPPGMEWFLPLFYLKLLLGHMLPEAPFQPLPIRSAELRHERTGW